MLNSEIRNLQTEVKYEDAEKKNIKMMDERIASLEKSNEDLENKLELKESKIEELLRDKEILFKSESEALKGKSEILEQSKDKELELQKKDQELSKLREKYKQSSSDLLGKSMQIDKLTKKDKNLDVIDSGKLKEFEEKIRKLETELENTYHEQKAEIEKSAEGSTRIISNIDDVAELLKKVLPQAKSNLRLVLPDIQDLSKYGLIDIIKEIPNKVRLNIAAAINEPASNVLVSELRNYCQMYNFSEKKIIALNIDSSKCLIGIFSGDNVICFYSELLEIIEILNPTIMEPFIKGRRV